MFEGDVRWLLAEPELGGPLGDVLPIGATSALDPTKVKIPSATAPPDAVTACVRRSPGGLVNTATKSSQWLPICATD